MSIAILQHYTTTRRHDDTATQQIAGGKFTNERKLELRNSTNWCAGTQALTFRPGFMCTGKNFVFPRGFRLNNSLKLCGEHAFTMLSKVKRIRKKHKNGEVSRTHIAYKPS